LATGGGGIADPSRPARTRTRSTPTRANGGRPRRVQRPAKYPIERKQGMSNPTDPATTPPAHRAPARRRRHTFGTALTLSALLAGLLAFSPFTPAKANPSAWCDDDVNHPSVRLVDGDF